MGDMGDVFRAMRADTKERKQERADENMTYLVGNNIQYKWVDAACDHVLIDGHIDYYLGKTYWFDRKTKKSGYAMLYKLLGGDSNE